MSEELRDEVEAINSIYGDGCLTPADEPSTYILQLPGDEASSLRLWFPDEYPTDPPAVLGTHHSSGGKKGAGARDLGLFRDAVGSVFQEGAVCLFDAVEDYVRRYEEQVTTEAADVAEEPDVSRELDAEPDILAMDPPPPWTLSETFVENRSTFVAHVAKVTTPAQARRYVQHLLASDKRIRTATHNMTAWRVRGEGNGVSFQDCDDDGEAAAGGRLLHLMQLMDLWDAMVVVTRWYGGVKLGPRRFAVINAVARDGFVRAGMVVDKEKKKGK